MKNICIIGFGALNTNYGTDLMSLAIQRALAHYGVHGYLVPSMKYEKMPTNARLKKVNPTEKRTSSELANRIFEYMYEYEMKPHAFRKRLTFMKFEKRFIRKTRYCCSMKEIEEEIYRLNCKAVMVESDCLWHPFYINQERTLAFSIPDLYRFSYAPSMFVSELSEQQQEKVKSFAENFQNMDKISVREKSGAMLLKRLVHVDAEVVVDPVMLLTQKQWRHYMSKPLMKKEYAFCYILEENPYGNKTAAEIAYKLGVKTIVYLRVEKAEKMYGNAYGIESILLNDTIGPMEFLRLICDAKYVFTDSFHAMNFSIIFNKIFFVFERQNKFWQPDDRVHHLLSEYGLMNQIVRFSDFINEEYLNEKMKIDYEKVDKKRLMNRKKSLKFIEQAVSEF